MTKKPISWIIAIIILAIVAFPIINKISDIADDVKFVATVLENNGNSLLVEPVEGSSELRSSDKISVSLRKGDGTIQDVSEFAKGTKVEITYDGSIMESYPAQIIASKITSIK